MGKEERVKVPAARAVNVVPSRLHLNMYENVGIGSRKPTNQFKHSQDTEIGKL